MSDSYDWTYSTPYALRGKVMLITKADFDDLPEYSATYPTGVYCGKMWRRHDGICDRQFLARGGKPRWVVCQYLPHPTDKKLCIMRTFTPFFVRRLKMPTHCGGKMLLSAGPKYGPSNMERIMKKAALVARLYAEV